MSIDRPVSGTFTGTQCGVSSASVPAWRASSRKTRPRKCPVKGRYPVTLEG